MANRIGKLALVFTAGLAGTNVYGGTIYNAALGSLPQAQGFIYSGDQGNPPPHVSGGILFSNKTVTATSESWSEADSTINFANSFVIEGDILINSSNFVPNGGDGSSREGYYLFASDTTGAAYSVGLTSTGFVINDYPSGTLVPYPTTSGFHLYDLAVLHGLATFSVDGTVLATGIAPEPYGQAFGSVIFGASSGLSLSNTETSFVCTGSGSACSAAAPEPASWTLALGFVVALAISRVRTRLFHG